MRAPWNKISSRKPDAPDGAEEWKNEDASLMRNENIMRRGRQDVVEFCRAFDETVPSLIMVSFGAATAMVFFLPELLGSSLNARDVLFMAVTLGCFFVTGLFAFFLPDLAQGVSQKGGSTPDTPCGVNERLLASANSSRSRSLFCQRGVNGQEIKTANSSILQP